MGSEMQAHNATECIIARRSRSSKVIDFGTNRKRGYVSDHKIVTWTISCTVSEIGLLKVKNQHFSYPTPIAAKIWGICFEVDPRCWGPQREERLGHSLQITTLFIDCGLG